MKSPTQLSLQLLKDRGYDCQVVEHWNAFARIRQDLFGIIDIVAVKAGEWGVLGVQTTSKANISARIKKSMQNKHLLVWYKAGNNFLIHGWGKTNNKWEVEVRELVKKKYLPKKE